MIEFKEWNSVDYFLMAILYKDKQIGTIQQNDDGRFYPCFRKSNFYWLDSIITDDATDYDLNHCKNHVVEVFVNIKKCFE